MKKGYWEIKKTTFAPYIILFIHQKKQYSVLNSFNMKNLTLFSGLVLSLLFVQCKNSTPAPAPAATTAAANGMRTTKIAYVDTDTLQEKYNWFKEQNTILDKKRAQAENEFEAKARQFQNEVIALQQKAQSGTVPPAQLQKDEQNLARRQQALEYERGQRSQGLVDETAKASEELRRRINEVLTELQKTKGYDYVVQYSKNGGTGILFVNSELDITNEVLTILNSKK